MTPAELDAALSAAVHAARAAGQVALGYYHRGFDVVLKPDQTPVTQADREAEAVIVERLRAAFPDHGVLGEEHGQQGPRERCWIIDPIDGTKNFVRRIPVWATLLALEDRGEVVVGVVHNPVTGELYRARRGGGAWSGSTALRVSDVAALGAAQFLHSGLNLLRASGHWDALVRLVDATERQRGFGDYLGYALVAEGKAEIYAEVDLKPWDLAPCKLLVEEAGGRFTDFEGRATIYSGTAVATNARLHDEVLALIRGTP
jgi:histidinol-phosphatase